MAINPLWIVPPAGVANDDPSDMYFVKDLKKGIFISDLLTDENPTELLNKIISDPVGSIEEFGNTPFVVNGIKRRFAIVLLNLINAGKLSL